MSGLKVSGTMGRANECVKSYRELREEYRYEGRGIWEEDERLAEVERIVWGKLTEAERVFLILYAELRSYRKLGKKVGLGTMTVRAEILRIRAKIEKELTK